jgi:hypothetical protein
LPQGIVPELAPRVEIVLGDDQGSIEEDLLALLLGDSMAKPVLLGIAGVPLELDGVCSFTHACASLKYTLVIYRDASCVGGRSGREQGRSARESTSLLPGEEAHPPKGGGPTPQRSSFATIDLVKSRRLESSS